MQPRNVITCKNNFSMHLLSEQKKVMNTEVSVFQEDLCSGTQLLNYGLISLLFNMITHLCIFYLNCN